MSDLKNARELTSADDNNICGRTLIPVLTREQQELAEHYHELLEGKETLDNKIIASHSHLRCFKYAALDLSRQLESKKYASSDGLNTLLYGCQQEVELAYNQILEFATAEDDIEEAKRIFDLTWEQKERWSSVEHPSIALPIEDSPYYEELCKEEKKLDEIKEGWLESFFDGNEGVLPSLQNPYFSAFIESIDVADHATVLKVVDCFRIHASLFERNPEYNAEHLAHIAWAMGKFIEATNSQTFSGNVKAYRLPILEHINKFIINAPNIADRILAILKDGWTPDAVAEPNTIPNLIAGKSEADKKDILRAAFITARGIAGGLDYMETFKLHLDIDESERKRIDSWIHYNEANETTAWTGLWRNPYAASAKKIVEGYAFLKNPARKA